MLNNLMKDLNCKINEEFCSLEEVENLGIDKFKEWVIKHMPSKLYKYYPNIIEKSGRNYSLESLKNNTIFLNDSSNFDDCFDCAIDLDNQKFYMLKLKEYCVSFRLSFEQSDSLEKLVNTLTEFFNSNGIKNEIGTLINNNATIKERLETENFYLNVSIEVRRGKCIQDAIFEVIQREYRKFTQTLKKFKIACFSTSPYLNRMWSSSYGNMSKGFCIEYTINLDNYVKNLKTLLNLFPVIYSSIRNDSSRFYLSIEEELNSEKLWQLYFNGLLRKNNEWNDQKEWRLILYDKSIDIDYEGHNPIPFFKITKVFLGNKMPMRKRGKVVDTCKKYNIEYVGLVRKENSFSLEHCKNDCFSCLSSFDLDCFSEYLLKKDHPLLQRALTDSSYKNIFEKKEKKKYSGPLNTELATLGDSLLKTVLCSRFLDKEPHLSKKIENYLTDKILVEIIAKKYNILEFLNYDVDDVKIPKNYNYNENDHTHKYIATAVEAVLGAIYLISGSMEDLNEIIEDWVYLIENNAIDL